MSISHKQLETWGVFLRTHAIVTDALEREMLAESGLSNTWYEVLVYLNSAPEGRMRMRDLAQMIIFTTSGLTRLMDRLEKAGLTRRESCPGDRRGTYAEITAEGRATLQHARPGSRRAIVEHFFGYLDEQDVLALDTALSKILNKEMEKRHRAPPSSMAKARVRQGK